MLEKIIVITIFVACYALAISRKIKIAYASMISAFLLILLNIVSPIEALKAVRWDVLAIYWGFMMVSFIFSQSNMPLAISNKIIKHIKKEKYIILAVSAITAFLSAFMENVGVVLMMAPVAIELAKKLKSPLPTYMIAIAISSNAVTTLTMVADPPSLILALSSGMTFFDFYWFQGKLGLGVVTFFGIIAALLSLLLIFRKMNKTVEIEYEKPKINYIPSIIFVLGVLCLAFLPEFGIRIGIIGLAVGLISLVVGRKTAKRMLHDFDWNSWFFIMGIFVVIASLEISGLLNNFSNLLLKTNIKNTSFILFLLTFISVAASSFIDNVPYTVLMIPVCNHLASSLNVSPFPFLFGMLIGTGIGGNITPVGATANVFACGIFEKRGYKLNLREYLRISLPFSLIAVIVAYILLQIIWL